ncbi:hypothetical protein QJS10_CPA03g01291 [Acorus calamus]|uniref:Cupin type-1 domain-containing protein n=1 Tax=Acorus calamus TaxID=4465 RepID=A0AAV9FCL4_ACOCL|nr:hypothetical protein QJS10_CPA03g01291 [Acorus calamus]
MGKFEALFLLLIVLLLALSVKPSVGYEGKGKGKGGGEGESVFMMEKSKQVVKTDGGEVRVLRGYMQRGTSTPMHIGFISMEPKTMFLPQYLDSSLILFIRTGEVKVGWIHKDEMVEKQLKTGDIYQIPAGSAFYLLNTGHGQRLSIICSIDVSNSLGFNSFQSFFIAGGTYPTSVLAGFDKRTLVTAFNVTNEQLREFLGRQNSGPIVYVTEAKQPHTWASLLRLKQEEGRAMKQVEEDDQKEEDPHQKGGDDEPTWTWRKLLNSFLGKGRRGKKGPVRAPDSYNLYNRKPDFQNKYGWTMALDESDYAPLKHSGIGVYFVNLTAGSMLAPHVNPTATEYGVVMGGSGTIQVVYPNGTSAMNSEVREGDAFWIPRYFPFCQIASRSGPLEFFGFTTSSRKNQPQFLVGGSSVLRSMIGRELAMAFDVSEDRLKKLVDAQTESIILPTWPLPPAEERRGEGEGEERAF